MSSSRGAPTRVKPPTHSHASDRAFERFGSAMSRKDESEIVALIEVGASNLKVVQDEGEREAHLVLWPRRSVMVMAIYSPRTRRLITIMPPTARVGWSGKWND